MLLYLVPPFIDLLPYPVKIFLFPFSFSSVPTTSLCCARCGRLPASGSYYWWRLHPLTWDICMVDREDLSLVLRSSHRAMHGARRTGVHVYTFSDCDHTCNMLKNFLITPCHSALRSTNGSVSISRHGGWPFGTRARARCTVRLTISKHLTIFINRDKNLPYYIGVFPKKSGTFPTLMVSDW